MPQPIYNDDGSNYLPSSESESEEELFPPDLVPKSLLRETHLRKQLSMQN